MNNSTAPMNKIIVQTIVKSLEEIKNDNDIIRGKIHGMEIKLTSINGKQENLSEDVNQLLKIIRDGNGQEPLLNRVNKIENSQKNIENFFSEQKSEKKQSAQGAWQAKTALITGTLSLVGVIITGIITLYT